MEAHSPKRSNIVENNNEVNKLKIRNPSRSRNNSENSGKAYVIEDDGMSYSVVPFYRKQKSFKNDPKNFTWSINKMTQKRTITRKDYFASGKWNETPSASSPILPEPPRAWLEPKTNFNHEVSHDLSSTYEDDSSNSSSTTNSELECCAIANCTYLINPSEAQCSDSGYYD